MNALSRDWFDAGANDFDRFNQVKLGQAHCHPLLSSEGCVVCTTECLRINGRCSDVSTTYWLTKTPQEILLSPS